MSPQPGGRRRVRADRGRRLRHRHQAGARRENLPPLSLDQGQPGRAPASASPPPTASSSNRAATSSSTPSLASAPRSASSCRRTKPTAEELARNRRATSARCSRRRPRTSPAVAKSSSSRIRSPCAVPSRAICDECGYEVDEAENGEEALETLGAKRGGFDIAHLGCVDADHDRPRRWCRKREAEHHQPRQSSVPLRLTAPESFSHMLRRISGPLRR